MSNNANRPRYEKAFAVADKDGSGSICKEELRGVLEDLGKSAGDRELERWFARADKDGSGEITKDEFLQFMDDVDNAWIRVQQKTFSRWANTVLSNRMLKVDDLVEELKDGIKLGALIEILAKKPVGKLNSKPRMQLQRAENINKCLHFLKIDGVKLVNIGADDIEEGNLKIILGLIWMLILKYQIGDSVEEGSPKWALLEWVKAQIAPYKTGVQLKNFKSGWSDGKVLSALADSLGETMYATLDTRTLSEDPYEATDLACDTAEREFDIPKIMDSADLVENPDEHSIMTYVSYFRDYADTLKSKACPQTCTASGPGVEGGDMSGGADFTIVARNKQGKQKPCGGDHFGVAVRGPDGHPCQVSELKDNGDGTYTGNYTVTRAGDYQVDIMLQNQHIKDSTFTARMELGCAANCYAEGEGLIKGKTGRPAHFTIFSVDRAGSKVSAGGDPFVVSVTGPDGPVQSDITDAGDGTYPVTYTPAATPGDYQIEVTLNGEPIKDAPFTATIKRAPNAANSWAEGPGLQKAYQHRPNTFTVHAMGDDGEPVWGDDCEVTMKPKSGGSDVPVQVSDNGDGTYTCTYEPTELGDFTIAVKLDGEDVRDTPVDIIVKRAPNAANSWAEGPGLQKAYQDRPNTFTVHAMGDDGEPVSGDDCSVVMRPADENSGLPTVPVEVKDNGDGTYDCAYQPTALGDYVIEVQLNGDNVKDTPVNITVKRAPNAQNSWAEGPGLVKAFDTKPAYFTVHARGDDGEPVWGDDCAVAMVPSNPSSGLEEVPVSVTDNGDGTYACVYEAKQAGEFTISVKLENDDVKDTPVSLRVREGACIDKTGRCTFKATIVARNRAGEAKTEGGDDWAVTVTDVASGAEIAVKTSDNGDGSYSAEYRLEADPEAEGPKEYSVSMTLNEDNIQGSPFRQFM